MAPIRLLNLLALSSLAVLASSFGALPVNALDIHEHSARSGSSHHNIAKRHVEVERKRDSSKRCKPRPSTASASKHAPATAAPAPSASGKVAAAAPATSSHAAPVTTTQAAVGTASSHKSSTSSSKAPVASSAPPASPGNGKVGLAWSNHEAGLIQSFRTSSVKFLYDWQPTPQSGMDLTGLAFISMYWGPGHESDFQAAAQSGKYTYFSGFNEPDISSQSNLSPSAACPLWMHYMAPLGQQGHTLISPAPATGPNWLIQFKKACPDADWTYTAAHVYTTTVDSFIAAVTPYQSLGKQVMITEYGCEDYSGKNQQCSTDEIWDFMQGTKEYMNSQPWIAAYFIFAPMTASELEANRINGANALITSDGKGITDLGKFYIQ